MTDIEIRKLHDEFMKALALLRLFALVPCPECGLDYGVAPADDGIDCPCDLAERATLRDFLARYPEEPR